jgi:Fe-S-cluster containining protein
MEALYDVLKPLTNQPECQTCRRCEENVGLVYLLGNEAGKAIRRELPVLTTSEGVQYLGRTTDGWCSSFNPATNTCGIYADRPLCCRIYPLDLMKLDGAVWWVIHAECPIAQRFQWERRLSILAAMTAAMERVISDEQVENWLTQDKTSQAVEAFSFDVAKVIKLRRYGESIAFTSI